MFVSHYWYDKLIISDADDHKGNFMKPIESRSLWITFMEKMFSLKAGNEFFTAELQSCKNLNISTTILQTFLVFLKSNTRTVSS